MSWVQAAVSRSSEDVFDEDADEMYLLQKEWNNTMKKRLKGANKYISPGYFNRYIIIQHGTSRARLLKGEQHLAEEHEWKLLCGLLMRKGITIELLYSPRKSLLHEGYKDGIEAGKEFALQEGFNQGYRQGAELMVTCGQFKGTLNALLSWCHFNGHDSALSKINNLLDAVGKHEEDVLKYLNSTEQQPHLQHILDSVQDMDLNHTAPPGTEYNEVEAGRHVDGGSSGENTCRSNGEVGSLQSESSKAKFCTDPERSTLAWVKKQTIWLIEELGLSLDILHHVQHLEH